MPKTLIYLHGAFDAGIGVASLSCSHGEMRLHCDASGIDLIAPVNVDPRLTATNWHQDDCLSEILNTALQRRHQGHRVYLAGHSMGGRGALMIGLQHQDMFDAVGAVAPALGKGLDRAPLSLADSFSVQDLEAALNDSRQPVFIGYASKDLVVRLNRWDFHNFNGRARTTIRNFDDSVHWLPPIALLPLGRWFSDRSPLFGPHNDLVAASARDLVRFFANLP